jgi:hypothetical protein
MLFGVVPVSREQRLNPIEFVAMYDRFCLMLPDELVRFAFFQMATVGKGVGEFPRIAVSSALRFVLRGFHEYRRVCVTACFLCLACCSHRFPIWSKSSQSSIARVSCSGVSA